MLPTFLSAIDDLVAGIGLAQRLYTIVQPILPAAPSPNPILATIAALSSIVALALLSGVAIGSVFVLLSTLLALYFVATEVLGLSLEINIP